jgi:hypothetical protein
MDDQTIIVKKKLVEFRKLLFIFHNIATIYTELIGFYVHFLIVQCRTTQH